MAVEMTTGTTGGLLARVRGSPTWTLVTVAFGVVMVGVDATVVAIANPYIGASFHASLSDLQWITNSYLLVLAVLLIVGGRLGDRYGRRLVFLIGVAGFAVASVGVGVVGSISGVIALRGLQGAFGALLMPNTLALLRVAYPEDRLNRAIGIWSSSSAAAVAGAPIIGALLVEHVSWQSVFYLNAPVAAVTCALGWLVLEESTEPVRQRLDTAGVVLLAVAFFAIVIGIMKAQAWGWGDSTVLVLLVTGAALMVVFTFIERRALAPIVPPRLFANRSVALGVVTVVLSFFALFSVLFFVSLYLQNASGLSPVAAAERTLSMTVLFAAASLVAPRLTTRFGPGPITSVGMLLVAVALFGLVRLEPQSGYLTLGPSLCCIGAGLGLVVVASAEAIIGNVSVDDAGLAGGLQATAVQFGGVLGASVLGSIVAVRALSVLPSKFMELGVPIGVVRNLANRSPVVQGLPADGRHVPAAERTIVATASHAAFMSGIHVAMVVGGAIAASGAVMGLYIRPGKVDSSVPVHF